MDGSGMIRVLKHNGSEEAFSRRKLASAMWRAVLACQDPNVDCRRDCYGNIFALAGAVDMYLRRSDWPCVSSSAIFEMAIKTLRRVGQTEAAAAMEAHRDWRSDRRRVLRVRESAARIAKWDKAWMVDWTQRHWGLALQTARILAADVESDLLQSRRVYVDRDEIIDRLNLRVGAYGLADAVPVTQPA